MILSENAHDWPQYPHFGTQLAHQIFRPALTFTLLVHARMLFFAAMPLTDRHCPTPPAKIPVIFQS
jgi:hypothetical protein